MAGIGKRTLLRDVNPHLICLLCRGYLIDATTVVECLHSFCRSCILKHLGTAAQCPLCKHVLNKAKPNIKADKALQEIVYKLVPGLYHREMSKRREFYKKHPEHANSATPEQRGEDVSGRLIFNPEDVVSLSLEYLPPGADPLAILSTNDTDAINPNNASDDDNHNNNNGNHNGTVISNRRYLQCPALVTIAHLKKFVAMKYSVDVTRYTIEICHRRATLPENWTLIDVAYIYAWKRIAPMRFFYRVAQEEQRLEAPLHQRPSTPGLGARDYSPSNNTPNDNSNIESDPLKALSSEIKFVSNCNEIASMAKDLNEITNDKVNLSVDCKQIKAIEKDEKEMNKMTMTTTTTTMTTTMMTTMTTTTTTTTTMTTITTTTTTTTMTTTTATATISATSPILTATNTTPMLTTAVTNISPSSAINVSSTMTYHDSNKQIKSPIKILKNPDGRYEVLKNPPAASVMDIKSPTNPEFSVVNSNGVKITLKQCSSPQSNNAKKPKVISNVLLRCSKMEKDVSSSSSDTLMIQQLQQQQQQQQQQDKNKLTTSPISPDKQEKQRRKVTFVDRPTTSEKITSTNAGIAIPKAALKKPAEQQDKTQFLQGFQLTAREPGDKNAKSIKEIDGPAKSLPKNNAKAEKPSKKDINEIKKKSNVENADSNANSKTSPTNAIAKRIPGISASNVRTYVNDVDGCQFNSGTSVNNANIASGNHGGKTDVYTFSNDPPIVPAGAVKRKCPPGVPIADLARRKSPQIMPKQEVNKRRSASPYSPVVKMPRISSAEHVIPKSKATNVMEDHGAGSSHVSNANNTKASSIGPLLSNDTRDFLVDGYGLNIPASLSITLTSPKSSGVSGQFVEPNDPIIDNNRRAALGKVNPSITLNDRSVDPRVLKALKTGQIRMPATPSKVKSPTTAPKQTATMDRSDVVTNQQRTTLVGRRKKEHELSRDILDLSGGNKKMDIHPLRIPQPVTKLNKANKVSATGRNGVQSSSTIDQGQVVTLMGGHRYYRAPPGSLTPAAHRVNDCPLPPSPSRTPVYAPSFCSSNRSNSDLSSVFPSLPSLYALHQAPNLQQFQMDAARLRLPPRFATESSNAICATGSDDNANTGIGNGTPGKSHLAAQCAPVKPARSSVAPLAVPINKQQSNEKSASVNVNRIILGDANKSTAHCNNEDLDSTHENSRLNVKRRYPSSVESTSNKFPSRNENVKSNSQAITNETTRDSSVEPRNESVNTDNPTPQQQQHREAASPNVVSSTASPSPPPGANNGANVRNEDNISNSDNNINGSNESDNTTPGPTKSIGSDVVCSKSPDSPDSSSITVESSGTSKNCPTTTVQEMTPTDAQITSDATKTSSEITVNPNDSTVDDSPVSDGKNKFTTNESEASEIAKQFNTVQKRLLAVFPTNEWANNPIAAEHLGNFLKSLNVTMKNEEDAEESKTEKTERQIVSNNGNENR